MMLLAEAGEVTLSAGQLAAVERVREWLATAPPVRYCGDPTCMGLDSDGDEVPHTHGGAQEHPVLSIGGLAGSGKTHTMGALAQLLGIRITYGTPTNKAAAVLRSKLPERERSRCGTYHSLLYRPSGWFECLASGDAARELPCACGKGFDHDDCACPRFSCSSCNGNGQGVGGGCKVEEHLSFEPRPFAGGHRDLIVLDEASMVTEEQVQDIRHFGLPCLLVGDHGQLAPVKGAISPWMKNPDIILEENFRQTEESGIIPAALYARQTGALPAGRYGTSTLVASGAQRPELYNALLPDRLPPGPDSAIITWTNRGRADINRRVHAAMAINAGEDPATLLVKNDRLIALGSYTCEVVKPGPTGAWVAQGAQKRTFNGQVGTVMDVLRTGKKFADIVIALEDPSVPNVPAERMCKIMRRVDLGQLSADRVLRPDERAPGAAAFDYAYALTCHRAQGSEFDSVAVVGLGPSGSERGRWAYTACTRARKKLLVIT
jgi:exodeoxyribonuclease V